MSAVLGYLQGRGAPFLVLPAPHAFRVEDTAARHGVDPRELIKTVAMTSRHGNALMVIPAMQELSLVLARIALNDADARPMNDEELVAHYSDLERDALPPLGFFLLAPMFVDEQVAALRQVVFPAGRVSLAICMTTRDLFRDDPVVVTALTSGSDAARRAERRADGRETFVPAHLAG